MLLKARMFALALYPIYLMVASPPSVCQREYWRASLDTPLETEEGRNAEVRGRGRKQSSKNWKLCSLERLTGSCSHQGMELNLQGAGFCLWLSEESLETETIARVGNDTSLQNPSSTMSADRHGMASSSTAWRSIERRCSSALAAVTTRPSNIAGQRAAAVADPETDQRGAK